MKFDEFMRRYTIGFFELIQAYCAWAESQAKSQTDLLLLGIAPAFLIGMMYWLLPVWLGKTLALVLLAPALYVVFVILRAYAGRGRK